MVHIIFKIIKNNGVVSNKIVSDAKTAGLSSVRLSNIPCKGIIITLSLNIYFKKIEKKMRIISRLLVEKISTEYTLSTH